MALGFQDEGMEVDGWLELMRAIIRQYKLCSRFLANYGRSELEVLRKAPNRTSKTLWCRELLQQRRRRKRLTRRWRSDAPRFWIILARLFLNFGKAFFSWADELLSSHWIMSDIISMRMYLKHRLTWKPASVEHVLRRFREKIWRLPIYLNRFLYGLLRTVGLPGNILLPAKTDRMNIRLKCWKRSSEPFMRYVKNWTSRIMNFLVCVMRTVLFMICSINLVLWEMIILRNRRFIHFSV